MKKALIAFYSRADENYVSGEIRDLPLGNTEIAAGMLKELTGAPTFKIEQVKPYAKKYNACIAQAQEDQKRDARPELKNYPDSINDYEVIYLGYPNYWGTMPMAVFTFLEHFDFSGKTIYPFCTHEGSGMGRSESDIKKLCRTATVKEGLALKGGSVAGAKDAIARWISK